MKISNRTSAKKVSFRLSWVNNTIEMSDLKQFPCMYMYACMDVFIYLFIYLYKIIYLPSSKIVKIYNAI